MDASVVDADGHVLEPLSAFDACPEPHRLHVTRDSYGLDHVFAGDQEIYTVSLGKMGTPSSDMADLAHSPTYDEAQPGGFDPELRLQDMDFEGIDLAVLYPSVGLNFWAITDPEIATSLARAYNDWLASYCAADRGIARRVAPRARAGLSGGVPPPQPVPRSHDHPSGARAVLGAGRRARHDDRDPRGDIDGDRHTRS
jgi:hypothetical protein